MAVYLALKEVWRGRGRYLLFSLVIALITILVLFIAALAAGLADANKQFIDKLEADLLVFQENSDLQATSSRLGQTTLRRIRRVEGVADAGPIGFSSGTVAFSDGREAVDVALIGVEPGRPGDPLRLDGAGMRSRRSNETVIDVSLAEQAGVQIGDWIQIKTIQGTQEKFFDLKVVGITDRRQYFFQPAVVLPMITWDRIRPQGTVDGDGPAIAYNMIAVRLEDSQPLEAMQISLPQQVDGIEAADKPTAILALPGYTAQQSTLNTQQIFTLLIGVLVVGGFFQIQTLQKVAQIGVLKAIGSPSSVVGRAVMIQIILVTVLGVAIGGLGTLLLAFGLPGNIPILFSGTPILIAIAAMLLIGPIGGLVSIRLALRIDPLTAIGLSQ